MTNFRHIHGGTEENHKNTNSRLPCQLLNPGPTERYRIDIQLAPNFGRMVEMKSVNLRFVKFCAKVPNCDDFDAPFKFRYFRSGMWGVT